MDANLKSSIDNLHRHIVDRTHDLVDTLVIHRTYHVGIASELMLYATQLSKLVPNESKPQWLEILIGDFAEKDLDKNRTDNSATEFARFILSHIPQIERPILTPEEISYNFDGVFDNAREAEEIPQTFDNLIEKLEKIIAADLIDSRVVQDALERLMALFKRNKHGSLTSILVTMHYGRFALKAFEKSLAAVPVLRPLVEAFKEEFTVAETKVRAAEETLKKEAVRRLINTDRLITYLDQSGTDRSSVAGFLELDDDDPVAAS